MSSKESDFVLSQTILAKHVEIGYKHDMSDEERNKEYDAFVNRYDNHVYGTNYNGPRIAAETVAKYIPESRRSNVVVLDIGAGTGLVGEKLSALGFTTIDALEPSEGMISKAKQKHLYRNHICESFSDKALEIESGTYDVITAVGCHGPNHVPPSAFHEMLRICKQGAIICVVTRAINYKCNDGYKDILFPICQKLEDERKWKKKEVYTFPKYDQDIEGVVIAYEVL